MFKKVPKSFCNVSSIADARSGPALMSDCFNNADIKKNSYATVDSSTECFSVMCIQHNEEEIKLENLET